MTHMYRILAIAGWAWLVLVAVFMVIRLTVVRRKTRGFDVVAPRVSDATRGPNARK